MAPDVTAAAKAVATTLEQGDRQGFLNAATALIRSEAPLRQGWKSLAQPLMAFGELALARQAIELYVRSMGNAPAALFDQATVLAQTGRSIEAQRALNKVGEDVPDRASNAYLRGTLALNIGDFDQAKSHLLRASMAHPLSGQIWQTLSAIGSMSVHVDVADRILAMQKPMLSAPEEERAPYLYALGKTLHDLERPDPAFAAFDEGARIVAKSRPYSVETDRWGAEQATLGWSAPSIQAIASAIPYATDRPIIVTGLPRSGTTLVEQILASHSEVAAGDELNRFPLILKEIGGVDAATVSRWAGSVPRGNGSAFYLHLLEQRFGSAGRVVDKTLDASRYLGVLAAFLPNAPIIWVRRQPLDCAWSCFRTYFLRGVPWSWSQGTIAAHFKMEDELLARWQDILGERLLVVQYESLVGDSGRVIPSIMAHCGLSVEPAVFEPEKTRRIVTTSSVSQVRSPINNRAIGAAELYRRELQLFANAYGLET